MGRVACFVIQGSGELVDYHCIHRYRELYPAKSFLTWVIIIAAEKKRNKLRNQKNNPNIWKHRCSEERKNPWVSRRYTGWN